MVEILPIKFLTDSDVHIFGSLNVKLGLLSRLDLPVADGIIVCAPQFKLQSVLKNYDFGSKEVFEQSLTLVKKEIELIDVPDTLINECRSRKHFLLNSILIKSTKELWINLLNIWLEQIRLRLWSDGFSKGITEALAPQRVIFTKRAESLGSAYIDSFSDDSVINTLSGKITPKELKQLDELIRLVNKKLFMQYEYDWVLDGALKICGIRQYTPLPEEIAESELKEEKAEVEIDKGSAKHSVKIFLDQSDSITSEKDVDGIYMISENLFDLNKPRDSYEDMLLRLVDLSSTFPQTPILFKLADKSEGMGKIRGTLRLLHQKSLLDPLVEALIFARDKKGLTNINVVLPFIRSKNELMQIKRELSVKKLGRKANLEHWMEIAVPENIINLEEYIILGLDGVVLNLDELVAFLNGFDPEIGELGFYKNEVDGLIKFLEDGIRLLNKSKIPFLAVGSLVLNPKVLEFLIEKGVFGIVIQKFEADSIHDFLHQAEKRVVLNRM